jgi:hypothetical protein
VLVSVAPGAACCWQLPPSHVALQLAPPWQSYEQFPPSHVMLQVAPPWQTKLQLPGSHVQLHTWPDAHTMPPAGIAAGVAAYSPPGGGALGPTGCGDA